MSVKLYGGNQYLALKQWSFPGGERGVTILNPELISKFRSFTIECKFSGSDDLMDIMLLVNACRNEFYGVSLRLRIPYFPYARQDRVTGPGEAFALQVACNVINSCNFYEVEVWDAHSDVLGAFFEPGVLTNIPQHKLLKEKVLSFKQGNTALIAPDAGALKKIYPLAKELNLPVIEARKLRDVSTGKINKSDIDLSLCSLYNSLIVVDDICDGGATFIQLAQVIAQGYMDKLALVTTHGIYSKGVEVLQNYYDSVTCVNDLRN